MSEREERVGGSGTVHIAPDELRAIARDVLRGMGTAPAVASEVARHLVNAERAGHASHGVLRLPQYAREAAEGIIDAAASPEVRETGPTTVLVDARFGFGHAAAAAATDAVSRIARDLGCAVATVRNSTHIGRLGEYTECLTARGLIGIVVVGAAGPGVGSMAGFGSASGRAFLNTNPWAIGVPSDEGDVVFDAAMTTIAEGKVHAARAHGKSLPADSVVDASGHPSSRPEDYYAGGTLAPLGGVTGGHKGYGLALSAALLGGLAHADGSDPALRGLALLREPDGAPDSIGGVTFLAVDPARFGDPSRFAHRVGRVSGALRADRVLVPGDLERRHRADAEQLVLAAGTLAQLKELAAASDASAAIKEDG